MESKKRHKKYINIQRNKCLPSVRLLLPIFPSLLFPMILHSIASLPHSLLSPSLHLSISSQRLPLYPFCLPPSLEESDTICLPLPPTAPFSWPTWRTKQPKPANFAEAQTLKNNPLLFFVLSCAGHFSCHPNSLCTSRASFLRVISMYYCLLCL